MIVRLSIRQRWWLPLYLQGVALTATLMDAEPDMDKMDRMIRRGLVVRVVTVAFGIEA